MEFPNWLAQYEPQVPLDILIEEVNKIFHSFDAALYDGEHPEIHQQLPPIWAEMIAHLPHAGPYNVLDLGCGTGFEAELVLNALDDKVDKLIAFDPSPEMLAICKARLDRFPQVVFCPVIEEAHRLGPFNLLLTNSLLHHLPNIEETMASLLPSLTSDAVWLAGHEPSVRFYRNDECLKLLDRYSHYHKYAKWFCLGSYTAKLQLILGRHPLSATARVAYEKGFFSKRPTSTLIDRIVDFHVPHSADEVVHGRGLDVTKMETSFQRDWGLHWSKSYSFLGSYNTKRISEKWVQRAHSLESQFPLDGANFCMVWKRKS